MRAKAQLTAGGIRVFSRHSVACTDGKHLPGCKRKGKPDNLQCDCPDAGNIAYTKCDCPKWLQFKENGKQVKESAGTRSFSQALVIAERRAKELSGEIEASPVNKFTIKDAVQDWLAFREVHGKGNVKAKYMTGLFVAFCTERSVPFMSSVNTDLLDKFIATLTFAKGNSSSFKIHVSFLSGFFKWAVKREKISKNPFPDDLDLSFERKELEIPTDEQINQILSIPETRLFSSLLRFSGMAIQDAATLKRSALVGNLITGKRLKTNNDFRVRIPMWLADELRTIPPVNAEYFFWDGQIQGETIADSYRRLLNVSFDKANVKMTPHGFRHFFISRMLSTGVAVEDVSHMVGTSANEIRKTYRHWIKEAVDRLDRVQEAAWLAQGLDQNGNPIKKAAGTVPPIPPGGAVAVTPVGAEK